MGFVARPQVRALFEDQGREVRAAREVVARHRDVRDPLVEGLERLLQVGRGAQRDLLAAVSEKDGQVIQDKGKGACLEFLQTGKCGFGAKCKFSHNKGFWDSHGVTWSAVRPGARAAA